MDDLSDPWAWASLVCLIAQYAGIYLGARRRPGSRPQDGEPR